MTIDITATNYGLTGLGINNGNKLTFDMDAIPEPGDVTLFEYDGKYQPVWFIGHDFLKHPIIAARYYEYPEALSLPRQIKLVGKLIKNNSY